MWLVPNLPLVAAASAAAIVALLLHHVMRILASIAVGLIVRKRSEKERQLEAFAKRGLVGRSIGLVSMLATSALRLLSLLAQACLSALFMLMPLILLSCALALVQLRWPATLRALNAAVVDDVQLVRTLLLAPFAFLAEVMLYTAPLYNFAMYLLLHAPIDLLLMVVRGLDAGLLATSLASLLSSYRMLAMAFGDYVTANPYECASNCSYAERLAVSYTCLDPGLRTMDLTNATRALQSGLLGTTRSLGALDANLMRVLNVALYPIGDAGPLSLATSA